jgi:hypothetical protein
VLNDEICHWKHSQKESGHESVTFISLTFPYEKQRKDGKPWGIIWASRETTEGICHGFISMLPSGWTLNDPSEFFQLFLKNLQQQWKKICSRANDKVEALVSLQAPGVTTNKRNLLIDEDLSPSGMTKSRNVAEVNF